MTQSHDSKSGVKADLSHDTKYNLSTQAPTGILHSSNGLGTTGTLADVQVGQEFCLLGRMGIDENSPATITTYSVNLYNKDAPFKMRINEILLTIGDLTVADFTDADAGALDVTLIRGDGATSETESDVLADQTLDDDFETGERVSYPHATVFLTNDVVVAGGTLRADLLVTPDATAGATNDGVWVDVLVRCMRIL